MLVRKSEEKRSFRIPGELRDDNIKIEIKK
jgi:hypothetical protein